MGCDIHLHAEVKWENGSWWPLSVGFDDRNYTLFALLAGVRNHSGVKPICEPRGLPPNLGYKANKDYETWESDAHSCSYLTLTELQNAETIVPVSGYVASKIYEQWKSSDEQYPASYCQGAGGGGVVLIEESEWDGIHPPDDKRLYLFCEWSVDIRKTCRFFTELVPQLEIVQKSRGLSSDDIRIVFWFDN